MSTEPPKKKLVIKKPMVNIKKYFRLFDFNTYDEVVTSDESSSDEEIDQGYDPDNDYKTYKRRTDDKVFVIQMFGVNESGETCCIYIKDFQPFFFVRVGNNWTDYDASQLVREIHSKIDKKYRDSIVSHKIVEYNKLYGFTAGKQDKFVQLTFKNTEVMNRVKNLWYTYVASKADPAIQERKRVRFMFQGISLELYESGNISPLLRYFHIHNISPSGWISFYLNKVMKSPTNTTTCTFEYICPLSAITPEPTKLDRVPFKICSFDIEASSSHGDFPVPVKTYKRLATNMVDTFQKQAPVLSGNESMSKMLFQRIILTAFAYDSFQDIDVVYPKVKPSKERVKHLIKILMDETIENAKKANTEEDNSALLRIDEMFETMNDHQHQVSEHASDEIEAVQDQDLDDEDAKSSFPSSKKQKKVSVDKILDILTNFSTNKLDPKFLARDEKIQITNEVLTRLLPRLEGDKVTFIGSTFLRYGELEPYLNHCVVLGSCDPVEGAVIEAVEDEATLLLKWAELMQQENPDIIIGYNIFGFDYEFMFRRAEENECLHDFLQLSRKVGELSAKPVKDCPGKYDLETTKIAIASGEYDLRYFKMTGRLQIDLYASFRREYILSSYKLDDVAGMFISDDIKRTEHVVHDEFGEVTELYSQNLMGVHVNDFIHIEVTGYTSEYHKKGQKFRILEINRYKEVVKVVKGQVTRQEKTNTYNVLVIAGHEYFEKGKSVKWTMAKDDVSPKDIFRLANGSSSDRAIVAKYCIQDCNLVHYLMNKVDILTGFSEMSKICSVPIHFLVSRGQGIKLTSYIAKKCREKNTLIPVIEKGISDEGYEGAIVLDPKCDLYLDNPVACVDYASLYPSSMISENLSHDSKVWTKEYDLDGNLIAETGDKGLRVGENGVDVEYFVYDNLANYNYVDVKYDTYKYVRKTAKSAAEKIKSGYKCCRFAQSINRNERAIMPSILEELLASRKATRKLIPNEKDEFMKNVLDKRQLGYKLTANSLYGQCGAKTSTFYEKDVAASTTATGRLLLTYAKRVIEECYGDAICNTSEYGPVLTKAEYIYGDTDSVFFTFNLQTPDGEPIRGKKALDITIELAQEAGHLASSFLKGPHDLEYEKTFMPFCLLSKKRYVGMLYETDSTKCKRKEMGIVLKRRDNAPIVKDVYGGIIDILMKEKDIQKSIVFLKSCLKDIVEEKYPIEKLIITKSLRSGYKNPQQIAHKVLADRIMERDPGNKIGSGDRIPFVYIKHPSLEQAIESDPEPEPEPIIEIQNNPPEPNTEPDQGVKKGRGRKKAPAKPKPAPKPKKVKVPKIKLLQGDKIETPKYIAEKNLKIDYGFYITNQIMKPVQQVFALVLEKIWKMQNKELKIQKFKQEIQDLLALYDNDITNEKYQTKLEQMKNKEVKALLFDEFLE
jgi:DNA polymerase elongation subunit (family B)